MLSLAMIDIADAVPGRTLSLVWGEENGGTRKVTVERHKQVEIRVTLAPAPYASIARDDVSSHLKVSQMSSTVMIEIMERGVARSSCRLHRTARSSCGCRRAVTGSGRPATSELSSDDLRRWIGRCRRVVDKHDKAGLVVLVAKNGKVVHQKAFGMADVEAGAPMRTDSIMRLYTMTKPITSVALLTLYEQGQASS